MGALLPRHRYIKEQERKMRRKRCSLVAQLVAVALHRGSRM